MTDKKIIDLTSVWAHEPGVIVDEKTKQARLTLEDFARDGIKKEGWHNFIISNAELKGRDFNELPSIFNIEATVGAVSPEGQPYNARMSVTYIKHEIDGISVL